MAVATPRRWSRTALLLAIVALTGAIVVVYAGVRDAGFIDLDDSVYVTANPFVRDGVTFGGVRQAFLGQRGGLWMPLTFLSHALDVEAFGVTAAMPHVENVAIHVLNAVLLLLLFVRATGALAPSLAAAALFALHPLRVESVAWIAERKDVLSTCFGLLTLHAWVSWVRTPDARRWAAVVASFTCALLAKPMLVTLPFLVVLFDLWPLGRAAHPGPDGRTATLGDLIREKRSLFALAGTSTLITLAVAGGSGVLERVNDRTVAARLVHAVVATVWYAGKTLAPTNLSVLYPMPAWTGFDVLCATGALVLACGLGVATWRTRPWIAIGFVWFGIGLLPILGLVQAGGQGMADRFTYLPGIGLVVAIVWTLDAASRTRATGAVLAALAVAASAALATAARAQVPYWRDSETLFGRALAVTHDNWIVHGALGNVLVGQGRHAEAIPHFAEAFRIEPRAALAAVDLGAALDAVGRSDEAAAAYRSALRVTPGSARAHNNLGVHLARQGDLESALFHFSEAVRLDPEAADATWNLRRALEDQDGSRAAVDGYLQGLRGWGAAIAADRESRGGGPYAALLSETLVTRRADALRSCDGSDDKAAPPVALYVQIDATGAVSALSVAPPTKVARCIGDAVRTTRAPVPPFAPFHAEISVGG